jgi:GcrA cell cycle regulator
VTNDDKQGPGNVKLTWPPERVEVLKKLWADGLTASQVAARLGDGITRNAVIGKVHRLGLSGRQSVNRSSTPRPRRPRQPSLPGRPITPDMAATAATAALKPEFRPQARPEPEPQPIRLVDIPRSERVTILMLTDKTCRWPLGDPGTEDFCFCGHVPRAGIPYCDYHASLAYQPLHDRRRASRARG